MKRYLLLLMILLIFPTYANDVYERPNDAKGFHWYNDPKELEEESSHENIPESQTTLTKENAEEVIKQLQKQLNQSKALAILNPTMDNIADYKRKQDAMTSIASNFASQWQKMLLIHPELDYSLKYSHNNSMARVTAENDRKDRTEAIKDLTNKYGLFFFYKGENTLDKEFAGVVHQFSSIYNVPIVAVSVGKEISPYFPLTKANKGIVEKLDIKFFPTLMLVDPKEEKIKPLSYGFLSLQDLENRFLSVSTDFKPNY